MSHLFVLVDWERWLSDGFKGMIDQTYRISTQSSAGIEWRKTLGLRGTIWSGSLRRARCYRLSMRIAGCSWASICCSSRRSGCKRRWSTNQGLLGSIHYLFASRSQCQRWRCGFWSMHRRSYSPARCHERVPQSSLWLYALFRVPSKTFADEVHKFFIIAAKHLR